MNKKRLLELAGVTASLTENNSSFDEDIKTLSSKVVKMAEAMSFDAAADSKSAVSGNDVAKNVDHILTKIKLQTSKEIKSEYTK